MSASDPATTCEPLTEAYRAVRALSARDAPCAAVLASDGGGNVMLVDAVVLRDWPGWGLPAQHLVGVVDVARTASGHVAVLPWCTERADAFVARRTTASSPLGGGEAVTFVVSVLRGLCDAVASEREITGCWWVTDAARPVFFPTEGVVGATGPGDAPIAEASVALVEKIAAACHERAVVRALGELCEALARPRRVVRDVEHWEERLFSACAPQPLLTNDLTAARARDLSPSSLRWDLAERIDDESSTWRDLVARHVDADLGDLVGSRARDAVAAVRRRLAGRRRAPWIVAVAVAGAVALGGAVWPAADGAGEASEPHTPPTETVQPSAPTGQGEAGNEPRVDAAPPDSSPEGHGPAEPGSDVASVVEAAVHLLDGLRSCTVDGREDCGAGLWEQPRATPAGGAVVAPERTVTLVDDYGGVAVVRVEAPEATPQLVVLARMNDEWLLRDVFDVAEQP